MNISYRSKLESFKGELDQYRSIAGRHHSELDEKPLLGKQLEFWFQSARFLITELEVWGKLENDKKYDETIYKLQKALNHVRQLITELLE